MRTYPDYYSAYRRAIELLQQLPDQLQYHHINHTIDEVLPAVIQLSEQSKVSEYDRVLLKTAALYHDVGFTRQIDNHEQIGVKIAYEELPAFGYDAEALKQIRQMILSTRRSQGARGLLAQLLCDADLGVLGRDNFIDRNVKLYHEQLQIDYIPIKTWVNRQIKFIQNHSYYTSDARALWDKGKKQNIVRLQQLLADPHEMEALYRAVSLTTYSAFVPVDRRRAILRGETLPNRTYGAALFVDVSGFTTMTERLVQHFGRQEGAEAVPRYINPLYDALIAQLHLYGGSVINFAGDSITCWLDGDDGRRALHCALAMQAVVKQMDVIRLTGDDVIKLEVKVAVAVGAARRFVVGSEENGFIDVLAGQTIVRMAAAEQVTNKGEVTVDIENLAPILDDLVVSEWRNDKRIGVVTAVKGKIDLDDCRIDPLAWQLSAKQAQAWLHEPILERLQTTNVFFAELRPVTALFLSFDGIDFDNDDDAGLHLNQFVQWIQGWLRQTSGYLNLVTFGDKGSYLYASFGAPLSFYNDESRAVRVALALRSAHERFDAIKAVYLGISMGRMWSGAYGSTTRATYGVLGHETNMAARLMGQAQPDQVVASPSIFERTSDQFAFDVLGEVAVKGRSEPILLRAVTEYSGKRATMPQFNHALTGRTDHLFALMIMWEEVKTGRGRIVRLIGAPGIGKSHLASVFADTYIETEVLWGNGDASIQHSSYSVWRSVFTQLFNLTHPAKPTLLEMIAPRLEQLGVAGDQRLPLLGDLFGVPLLENETTTGFEPQARQEALFALLKTILANTAEESPRLIVIDNAQWLDNASLQLVMAVAADMEQQAIMVLLLTRPVDETEAWKFLATHSDILTLSPLNTYELDQLVRDLLGGEVAPLVLDVVERQTLGNPFFVEALLVAMQAAGKLVYADSEWTLIDEVRQELTAGNMLEFHSGEWRLSQTDTAAPLNIELPNTIYASILHQFDCLPEQSKLTLKVASTIGYQFDLDLLHSIHPQKESKSEIALCAAHGLQHGLVHQYDDETYTFNHHLTQEVIYSTLLYTQRRQLRADVAQTLARPDYVHSYSTEEVATHAYEGQAWELALFYYIKLGREAQSLFANQQAIFAYQRAAECVDKVDHAQFAQQAYQIALALGELHTYISDFEQARIHLDIALSLAETPFELTTIYRWLAQSWEGEGEFRKALEQIDLGLHYQSEETLHCSAEMHLLAGLIHTRQGNYDQAEHLIERVFEMVYEPVLHGRAYNLSGMIHRLRGNGDHALSQFQKALKEYSIVSHIRDRALVLNQMATIYFDHEKHEKAEKLYQEALNIFVQTGDRYHRLFVTNNLGGIARLRENYDQALDYFDDALHQLEGLNKSSYVWAILSLNRAVVFSEIGRFKEADAGFDEAEQLFKRGGTQDILPELYREKARLALKQEQFDRAEQLIKQSISMARELDMTLDLSVATTIYEAIVIARKKTTTTI